MVLVARAEIAKNEEIKRLKDELKPFNDTFKKEGLSIEEETAAAILDEKITAAEEAFTVNLEALNARKDEAIAKAKEAKATFFITSFFKAGFALNCRTKAVGKILSNAAPTEPVIKATAGASSPVS